MSHAEMIICRNNAEIAAAVMEGGQVGQAQEADALGAFLAQQPLVLARAPVPGAHNDVPIHTLEGREVGCQAVAIHTHTIYMGKFGKRLEFTCVQNSASSSTRQGDTVHLPGLMKSTRAKNSLRSFWIGVPAKGMVCGHGWNGRRRTFCRHAMSKGNASAPVSRIRRGQSSASRLSIVLLPPAAFSLHLT